MQPSMDLTLRLPEPKANRKTVLIVKCFREASLRGSKRNLVSWCRTRERFQEGIPLFSWICLCGTIQEISEIFIAADINGQIPKLLTMAGL